LIFVQVKPKEQSSNLDIEHFSPCFDR